MAVIKYDIEGKANTKPIKETEKSVEGLFKKVSNIDNKLKAFVGVKVFSEVGKAIGNSLKKYDDFQKSVDSLGKTNLSKQFSSIETAMSGTLGTIRDEMATALGNIFGGTDNNVFKSLEETIVKVGANLIASMKVAELIVKNIKTNFDKLIKPEAWNDFFSHASDLASKFGTFLANVLKDVFSFAVDFFKWGLKDLNILQILLSPLAKLSKKFITFLDSQIPGLIDAMEQANENSPANRNRKKERDPMPSFSLSNSTGASFQQFSAELKKTFKSLVDTLAGTDTSKEFNKAYDAAFAQLNKVISDMNKKNEKDEKKEKEPPKIDKNTDIQDVLKYLKDSLSEAGKGFSEASGRINNILGNATGDGADLIRERMKALDIQFQESSKKIDGMFDALKKAESADKVTEIFNQIAAEIGNIDNLAGSMGGLEKEAKRAANSSELLQGVLQAIGDLGTIINAIMTSNWIGLIITLISKLADTFGNLSSNAAAAQNILDVLFDVIEKVISELGPWLDMLFEPLLDIFTALGNIIGNVLNVVIPIVALITQITDALSLLTPILNAISIAFAFLADCIGWVWNKVANFLNKIPFINLPTMATDNLERLMDSFEAEQNYDDYQNNDNSTSYSVAGDMYIYINYNHSYVNGDARQIALSVRDEIRLAEASGY